LLAARGREEGGLEGMVNTLFFYLIKQKNGNLIYTSSRP